VTGVHQERKATLIEEMKYAQGMKLKQSPVERDIYGNPFYSKYLHKKRRGPD
jgi:hypothetical protein